MSARPLVAYGCLNLGLLIVEVGYGLYAGSLGLVSDGVHLGINCFGIALSLIALRLGRKPPSLDSSFGHDRVHVLAAFTNAVFMCFVAIFLAVEGLHQFLGVEHGHGHGSKQAESPLAEGEKITFDAHRDHQLEEASAGHAHLHHHAHEDHVIAVALAGLVINLLGLFLLAWGSRSSHGGRNSIFGASSKSYRRFGAITKGGPEDEIERAARMLNLQGIVLHATCDVFNSVGVICSAVLVRKSGWTAADPLAAVMICGVIMWSSVPLLMSSGRMLLQVAPFGPRIAFDKGIHEISAMPGVLECHRDHMWEYAPSIQVCTLHVRVRDGADEDALLLHINQILSSFAHHVTVQITKDHA